MNIRMLKSKMVLFGDTNETLSDAIGISKSRFSAKLNGSDGAEFTQGEIKRIKDRYCLTNDETDAIFFSPVVSC